MGEPPELLELPEPASPGPGELLIGVQAAGIGPWDAFVGAGGWHVGLRPPAALGVEGTGVVAAIGENVSGIATGDAVLVHETPLPGGSGFWAEQVLVDASHVAHRPAGMSPVVAGGLPVAGLTAVAANTRLLVTGASGVTGAIAVQLAAELTATIVATAGAHRAQRLVGFGADQVIDSHEPDWAERVEGEFDAALVAVRDTSAAAMTLVRDGGRLCSITSDAPSTVRGIESTDLYVRPDADQLIYLVDRCVEGRLQLDVLSVALADGPSVAQRVIAGQSGGRKYVLSLAHW